MDVNKLSSALQKGSMNVNRTDEENFDRKREDVSLMRKFKDVFYMDYKLFGYIF